MHMLKILSVWGIVLFSTSVFSQTTQNWSAERNVLPPGYGATEARVVILTDGSINVTFRGSADNDPQVSGIYCTRSTDQGYSWSRPKMAVEASGIQSVTHELLSDGDSMLVYVAVNRLQRYEVQQFVSVDRGQNWSTSEVIFSDSDPIRGMLAWQMDGRMFMIVLVERSRDGGESEYTFWLARGRASGAYWEPAAKIGSFFARRVSAPRLVHNGRWPMVLWMRNGVDFQQMDSPNDDGVNWRVSEIATPPPIPPSVLEDRGTFYRVQTTANRQLLFNRTDDEAPVTELTTEIPRELLVPNLKLSWQGKDNYTLPEELRYQIQLDEAEPVRVNNATSHELVGLVNGSHLISLAAVDEAGNRQAPSTTRRILVKVPPVPLFLTPRNGDLLNTRAVSATWEGSQNCGEGASLEFNFKVDEVEWSGFKADLSTTVPNLADGDHAFFLQARDALGNTSAEPVSVRFEVDATPPVCTVQELPRDWDQITRDLDFEQEPDYAVNFKVSGTDNRTAPEALEYRFRIDQEAYNEWRSVSQDAAVTGLPDGTHTLSFEARDEAQNIQLQPTLVHFIYNTPPNTRVWIDESGTSPVYRFAARDKNSRQSDLTFRWRVDENSWSDWTSETSLSIPDLIEKTEHGQHILYVQSRDAAGNEDPTPAQLAVDVDKQAPPTPQALQVVSRDDGGEIQISWEAVPEQNVLYRIYRSNNKTFSKDAFAVELELEKTRGFDRPKRLKNTAVFYYFVTALDRSGNESPPVVSDPVEVLGEVELNVKRFNEYKADVETRLRAEEFDKVLEMAAGVPTPLIQTSEFAPYPAFWKAVAQARKVIRDDSGNGDALNSAKNDLENFLSQYSATPLASEAQSTLDEVKSKILWHQIMTYGMYGGGTLLILLFVWMGVRWNKRERATEMPMIQAGTDTEGITPSKEALKDPTVVRRWVEVQADPNTAENWSRLAFAFHNIGEIENAIQALYKAMEIEPNNTRFHFQMGHFQKESGKVKEAIRHFERYLALNPESKKSVEEVKELLAKLKQEPGGKE